MSRKLIIAVSCAAALAVGAATLAAQGGPPQPGMGPALGRGPAGEGIQFLGFEMGLERGVVTGAPYSATVTYEHTETLADGNQISRQTTSKVYRDSQGRTRREQTLPAIGAFAASEEPPQATFINDPVAGVRYILDPARKTVRRFNLPQRQQRATDNRPPRPRPQQQESRFSSRSEESLGSQNIGSLLAQGTRVTHTIPAGRIGNAQPIEIVTERWFSPELNVYVQTKITNPLRGTTTVTLSDIRRDEPDPTLFQVPADYTLQQVTPRRGPARPRLNQR